VVSEAAGGSPSSLFGPDTADRQQQAGPRLGVQHIRIPQQYIAARYPLTHASISPDGMDVAVAGTRGLGLYSRRSSRWRLFGDVSQEREIMVQVRPSHLQRLNYHMCSEVRWIFTIQGGPVDCSSPVAQKQRCSISGSLIYSWTGCLNGAVYACLDAHLHEWNSKCVSG